ncbi:unnamed protein product [Malus baccata var. baccata]
MVQALAILCSALSRSSGMDTAQISKDFMNSGGGGGVFMMSNTWRDEQHPSFINFISAFLDFIFNCGGSSVAFVFVTSLESTAISQLFGRVEKLKMQFPTLCVVITLPTMEQDDLFVRSSLKFGMELGMPTLVLVKDLEQENVTAQLKAERKQTVQAPGIFQRVIKAIPGIDTPDTNASNHEAFSTPLIVTDLAKSRVVAIEKSDDIQRRYNDVIGVLHRRHHEAFSTCYRSRKE